MSHGGDDEVHEEHEEHVNHEAWVIPYADLLTLLMAMFIALFAMSTVDVTKFKAFAIGFPRSARWRQARRGRGRNRERHVDAGRQRQRQRRARPASRSCRTVPRPTRPSSNSPARAGREQSRPGRGATPDARGRAEADRRCRESSSVFGTRGPDQAAEQRAAGHAAHRQGVVPERAGHAAAGGPASVERHRCRC